MSEQYGIKDLVKDALTTGIDIASPETVASRRALCNACEMRNTLIDECTACGCFLPAKTRLSKASCPMDLWQSE